MKATYRSKRVIQAIRKQPRASNREIMTLAGITDGAQASKLLKRLEQDGQIRRVGVGARRGAPNEWELTGEGERRAALG